MNFDEIWRALARTDALPKEAIETSLAHWDELADRFLAKLRAKASGARVSEDDETALFIALHMFAEKREARAYLPLCRILETDVDVEDWLGDSITESLPGILINLFDGDPEPLQRVVENARADEWARSTALRSLGYLIRTKGALSDEAMRDWLKALGASLSDLGPDFGAAWATTVAALGYSDLAPDVARAMSKGLIDPEHYAIKDFHADLQEANSDPSVQSAFVNERIQPFGTALEVMANFGEPTDPGDDMWDPDAQPFELPSYLPHVNPFRDLGRNDPCHCGSGKKYKKCCLAKDQEQA